FDASINRIAAWVVGARAWQKALLIALLEPQGLAQDETQGDFTARMARREAFKTLPWGAVWAQYLAQNNLPQDAEALATIRQYEQDVLLARG
ncbi:MAG: L-rhamnose isomerase, partial [Victivallales bacterium]|nr:L-rhamnose isomerase [Victivallales bacterium]